MYFDKLVKIKKNLNDIDIMLVDVYTNLLFLSWNYIHFRLTELYIIF